MQAETQKMFTHDDMKITLLSAKCCIELLGDYKLELATKAIAMGQYNVILQDITDLNGLIISKHPRLDLVYEELIDCYIETYGVCKSDFIIPDYIKLAKLVREGKIIRPIPVKQ
jgi:hypothetical protein